MLSRRVMVGLLLLLSFQPSALAHNRKRREQPHLFPTAGSLLAQNAEANRLHLPKILNDRELAELVQAGELVAIEQTTFLTAPKREEAVLRPWANDALVDLA